MPKTKKQSSLQNACPFLGDFSPQGLCKAENKAVETQVIAGRQHNLGCEICPIVQSLLETSTHHKGLGCAETQLGIEQGAVIW